MHPRTYQLPLGSLASGWLILLSALALCSTAKANYTFTRDPNHVYICTFNVYRLADIEPEYDRLEEDDGESTHIVPDRIKNLARVLSTADFDLIVLQEVTEGDKGQWALSDLVAELNASRQERPYQFFLSGGIGMGMMPEAMAFIYTPATIQPQAVSASDLSVNIPIGGRDLVKTKWVAGNFDFTLISAHLAWGDEADRKEGDDKLRDILENHSSYSDDPDVIVVGDTNRFGSGFDFWDGYTYSPSKFLAPNIVAFDPQFNARKQVTATSLHATPLDGMNPQFLSTTAAKNTFVYDVFLLSPDADEELPGSGNAITYGVDWGIIHFDEPGGFGFQQGADALDSNEIKVAYSDHRPLWVRFQTNTANSDSAPAVQPSLAYVATAHGKKFHKPECPTIAHSTITVTWTSRDAATQTHTPCAVCKP